MLKAVEIQSGEVAKALANASAKRDPLWRPRADSSASTAMCSSTISSYPTTPEVLHALDAPNSDFDSVFMLPAAENPDEGVIFPGDDEMQEDPISRIASPAHKARRLTTIHCMEAAMRTISPVEAASKSDAKTDDAAAPSTPQTPRGVCGYSARFDTPPRLAKVHTIRTPPMDMACMPRQESVMAATMSPRSVGKVILHETPPVFVPSCKSKPPLLRALEMKSAKEVKAVLDLCPEAANELFWDVRGVDHPLCCAIRNKCSAEIVQLLIEHGAQLDATGKEGRTPLQLLSRMRQPDPPMVLQQFNMSYEPVFPPWMDGQLEFAPLVDHSAWQQEVHSLLVID